jgi:hypothetical protein
MTAQDLKRDPNGPKTLEAARQKIAELNNQIASLKVANTTTPTKPPVQPSAPPTPPPASGPRQGEPRYPSVIRGQMLAERNQHRLFQLYREHQESEKFYGKYSGL